MRARRLTDADAFTELADVLVVLEDFLLHADAFVVDDLAGYPLARPDDPPSWVLWVAGLLGEHAATLRAPTRPTTQATTMWPAHQRLGEPR
jgi:hypothetical protein